MFFWHDKAGAATLWIYYTILDENTEELKAYAPSFFHARILNNNFYVVKVTAICSKS